MFKANDRWCTAITLVCVVGAWSASSLSASAAERQLVTGGPAVAIRSINVVSQGSIEDLYSIVENPLSSLTYDKGADIVVSVKLAADTDRIKSDDVRFALTKADGYAIDINPDAIEVVAATRAAALYALDHLAADLTRQGGRLYSGRILNWADIEMRALHFSIRNLSMPKLRMLTDKARRARVNMLIVWLADDVRFNSGAVIPRPTAISKEQLVSLKDYANASGMEFVPHLSLLTKQHRFFRDTRPELMYNNVTYNPALPELYELIFPYIDEIIETLQPAAIHIGHDEVEGVFPRSRREVMTKQKQKRRLKEGDKILPPWLFLHHVKKVNNFLTERGVETWMWGDMLLAKEDFPEVGRNLNGFFGYADLLPMLPANIVICDWQYWYTGTDFRTTRLFASKGHTVFGATWREFENIQNFSHFIAAMGQEPRGMIATTWFLARQDDQEIVDRIIEESGRYYWSAEHIGSQSSAPERLWKWFAGLFR